MKKVYLLHLGIGNVGSELVNQIAEARHQIEKDLEVSLIYCGLFTSSHAVFSNNGLNAVDEMKKLKTRGNFPVEKALSMIPKPFVLIDTTTSDITIPYIKLALKRKGFAVLSNKRPLSSSQKDYDLLRKLGGHNLFFETVACAGLPVMHTLKTLSDTGDDILEIKGCFSGTLGFIFSEIDRGSSFSKAVIDAKNLGYTERDPREDLSGRDVARKALIFARLLGMHMEMEDIKLESLYPSSMKDLTLDEFMKQLPKLDQKYQQRTQQAARENKVLRYIATINKKECTVKLEEVGRDSDFGMLKGPDNMIVLKTKRYYNNPMVFKGPGAGIEVTAAGLFGDIIHIIRRRT